MERIRWLSETRARRIAETLTDLSRDWIEAWWVCAPRDVTWRHVASVGLAAADSLALLADWDGCAVAYPMSLAQLAELGRHIVDVHDGAETALARRIGQEALGDLLARIQARIGATGEIMLRQHEGELPAELGRASRGSALFSAAFGGVSVRLAMNSHLADRLAPGKNPPEASLSRRDSVVGLGRVRLQLRLDLGDLALGELRQLTVGEVIASRVPLDHPFELGLAGAPPLATARLGRDDRQRAVVLLPHESSIA